MSSEELFAAAEALEASERWRLVERLLGSLPADAPPCPLDVQEIERRSAAVDAGDERSLSRAEVSKAIAKRLASYG